MVASAPRVMHLWINTTLGRRAQRTHRDLRGARNRAVRPMESMEIQPITYRGRTVAACTPHRVFFSEDVEVRAPEDPLRRFVEEMCQDFAEVDEGDDLRAGHAQLEIGTPPAVVRVPTSRWHEQSLARSIVSPSAAARPRSRTTTATASSLGR